MTRFARQLARSDRSPPIRVALVLALAAWSLAALPSAGTLAQEPSEAEDKVSNDDPSRPLQMPPASTEVREAFSDFDRFQRRGAWERAFKAVAGIPAEQTKRFVDGKDGFIISVAQKRREVLSQLPPEGRAAYRLYHDADAKRLFEQATGATAQQKLEQIFSAEFTTSIGDNAADLLGDLYFEQGRFDRAADCWLAILEHHPDTDLSPALVLVKAAWALLHAGRRAEFDRLRREVALRYADESVTIGGQSLPAEAFFSQLAESNPSNVADSTEPSEQSIDLTQATEPSWRFRFADAIVAGMSSSELQQWETNPVSTATPKVAVHQGKLYANYLGYLFALDVATGKLLWRSAPFHQLDNVAKQSSARYSDPERYEIVADGKHLWRLWRELDKSMRDPFKLTCHLAESGDQVWSSADLSDYASFDLVGKPLLAGQRLFVAAKSNANQQELFVLAVRPHDGKLLWKSEVGKFRVSNRYYYSYSFQQEAQPRLVYDSGTLYCETQEGVLAQLDADTGDLRWGFGYRTASSSSTQSFIVFGYYGQPAQKYALSGLLRVGDALLVKGMKSNRLCAVSPGERKLLWERPISQGARLLAADECTLYLGGDELSAMDLRTRELIWATRVPGGTQSGSVLVRPEGVWQFTSRGIFEIDPQTGHVRRVFRGEDLGAAGGGLYVSDHALLSVSNRSITAYPLKNVDGEGAQNLPLKADNDQQN